MQANSTEARPERIKLLQMHNLCKYFNPNSIQANIPNKTEYIFFQSGGEFHDFKCDYLKGCNGR